MFAGSISSISYLAVPAKAFETDWQYIMSKIATVCGLMFVALVVVVQLSWVEVSVAISVMAAMLIVERPPSERGMFALAISGGSWPGSKC
mgnify:CR=1 FL=1